MLYLIVADDEGGHAASTRLFPSTRPYMLGTLFPHLCPLGVPVDDTPYHQNAHSTEAQNFWVSVAKALAL